MQETILRAKFAQEKKILKGDVGLLICGTHSAMNTLLISNQRLQYVEALEKLL